MPLSAKTIKDRTIKMATDVTSQQISDVRSAPDFSIACDETCDGDDIAQVALLGKYINDQGPQELIVLLSLRGQTRGEDIASAVTECLKQKYIDINRIISVATDGAPSMKGTHEGFVTLLKKSMEHDVISFHCKIHQEVLCAHTFPEEISKGLGMVMQIVKIMASALNYWQFCELLREVNSQCSDFLVYNKVRWLSRGAVLVRFASCLEEIEVFLQEKALNIQH
ncbi:unnamed protein product [Caretta caretta]